MTNLQASSDSRVIEAAKELLRRRKARASLHDFICYLQDDYIVSDFSRQVCAALDEFLEDMAAGKRPVLILGAPPQHGKLVSDHTPVLTTKGWKSHGDLVPGDYVYSPSGHAVRVLAITSKAKADMRVTLGTGEVIYCHENHEWTVFNRNKKQEQTLETNEMLAPTKCGRHPLYNGQIGKRGSRYTFQLPHVEPIQGAHAELPIHPYVLGVWLGDGSQTKPAITHDKKDMRIVEELVSLGHSVRNVDVHKTTGVHTTYFHGLRDGLMELGVYAKEYRVRKKHIPDVYLCASIEQRLDLLAGLIDTDGYTYQKNGRMVFTTADRNLADTFCQLLSTFGWNYSLVTEQPKLSSSGIQGVSEYYVVGFNPTMAIPCRLDRKKNTPSLSKRRRIPICDIQRDDAGHVGNCIQVDSPDGLYLVGRTMQPTHNSQIVSRYLPAYMFGKYPDIRVAGLSYAKDLASDMNRDVQRIMLSPEYDKLFPESSLNPKRVVSMEMEAKRNSDTFEIMGRKGSYVSQGVGGPLTGKRVDCLVAGTRVLTTSGEVAIERLEHVVGKVQIVSHGRDGIGAGVLRAFKKSAGRSIYRVSTKGGASFECTGDHRVFADGVYTFAKLLKVGQSLLRYSDGQAVSDYVASVERVRESAAVYDIEVDGNHNFFANGVLVHNCGIVDDPIKNAKEALSQTVKDGIWNWYVSTFLTRLSKNSGQIIMATRWATDDLSGKIIEQNKRAKVLAFPAINEQGEALVPDLHPIDKLLETKATLGEYFWSAMYQQSPVALGGNMFKSEWWQYYDVMPEFKYRAIFADTAQKTAEQNDYSVFQCWGFLDGRAYLIDQLRGKWEAPDLLTRARAFWNKHKAVTSLGALRSFNIEDKSSGTGLIQTLKKGGNGNPAIPVRPIQRDKDKITRAMDALPSVEAGLIYLPREAPFLSDFLEEISAFPTGAHDDQVDPLMDAVTEVSKPKFNFFA